MGLQTSTLYWRLYFVCHQWLKKKQIVPRNRFCTSDTPRVCADFATSPRTPVSPCIAPIPTLFIPIPTLFLQIHWSCKLPDPYTISIARTQRLEISCMVETRQLWTDFFLFQLWTDDYIYMYIVIQLTACMHRIKCHDNAYLYVYMDSSIHFH